MSPMRQFLLACLDEALGSMKYEDIELKLARSGKLGFGVQPLDVISRALRDGVVTTFDDGGKTWLRKAAPFVVLFRHNDCGRNYLSYTYTKGSRPIDAVEGQTVDVCWPSGKVSTETVTIKLHHFTYEVEGCQNAGLSRIPGIEVDHEGIKVWLALDTEGIQVRADAF